ncbi:MAG: glycosyltransferase [Candidatus Eisenbacteria bacterium]|nr:glycosyltransferase [Candidatus Eisenbacteria bacterium]
MRTLGVVIPCYRQERFLPRTLAALRSLPGGWTLRGALVLAARSEQPLPEPGPLWCVVGAPPSRAPLTPGAARMAGLARCSEDWVLFVDADVEIEFAWLARALEIIERTGEREPRLAGLWGRIEEWFVDAERERAGLSDLYRVGDRDREVDYLATLALYRRDALIAAGGYDPRLSSEEDFELGLRLRARGERLHSLGMLAARHWSAPRPSFGELRRRWRSGLCFGQGQVLRLYAGRPGFAALLRRQMLYVATLLMWALGAASLALALARGGSAPLLAWLTLATLALAAVAVRKRSARLAAHSLVAWTLNGVGMLVGWFRIDPRRSPEAAC